MKKIILGAMIAISVIGCGMFSGCAEQNENTRFPAENETVQSTIVTGESQNGLALTVSRLSVNDYGAYNVSPQTETAYTLTATYKPSYVTNAELVWSVSFMNGSSTWATGKKATDYVTVTPASANTAVVSVVKAFGEQIQVLVKSKENPNVSASVLCDYQAAVCGGNIALSYEENGHSSASDRNVSMSDFSTSNTAITMTEAYTGTRKVDFSLTFGDGTTFPETGSTYVSVYLENADLYEAVKAGNALLPVRSDVADMVTTTSSGLYIEYEKGDEINLDLPMIDLLTSETRTLIIQSRDYMLGYTSTLPTNWDNGETYAAYCQIMNSANAALNGRIALEIDGCKLGGEHYYTELVWAKGWFKCPITSLTLDQTRLEF